MAGGNFGGGTGAPGSPFLVEDGADFDAVRNGLDKLYKQVGDINLSAYANFVPISTFTGAYDGGGFKITNINIDSDSNRVGLFGYATGDLIGINIENGQITSTNYSSSAYAGGIAGRCGIIKHCSNKNVSITRIRPTTSNSDSSGLGGVAGMCSEMSDCFNTANVTHNGEWTCGVVATSSNCVRCYNKGTIKGYYFTGGVCRDSNASHCYNTGILDGLNVSGVVVCDSFTTSKRTTDCYNTGDMTGPLAASITGVTGFVGARCYNTGTLTGKGNVFGVSSSTLDDSYNAGSLTSLEGGVYGVTSSSASRCYNSGNIRAFTFGYGITSGVASNCYGLFNSITRIAGSLSETTWAKITPSTHSSVAGNYALDSMVMIYE